MLLGTAGTAGAAGASGDSLADPINRFQSLGTLRCMDDNPERFKTLPCNGGPFQDWRVHTFQDGTRRFQNVATGRCIAAGAFDILVTASCNTSENQSWFVLRHHNVRLTFRNQATDRCIDDSDDSGFRTFRCNGGIFQDWV